MKPLIGQQLAILPDVDPCWLSNPSQSCPTGQSYETPQDNALAPQPLTGPLAMIHRDLLRRVVAEEPPSYGQPPSPAPPPSPERSLSPEQAFAIGDEVKILDVQRHQAKAWVGKRGVVHRLSRTRVWVKLPILHSQRTIELPFPVDCLERCSVVRKRPQRRHSPKGKASGWMEERQGNKKRKTPSVSYYYGWLEEGVCRKRYVPAGKVHRVNEMIHQRRPVADILTFIGEKKKP
ncbi:site-specific DNA methylase [Leptolyngbya sp. BL0902]|uniref:hypothetical protein n=1 Tax=Leptolyngbya sp. BL0902 TaxID=1115757 RepID=UPI0018E7EE62|nr:hypothetical protein [Leptolyngbya sp. BL0902]QQE64125.1 site-specific DNA methylase [Leptolyngbya sp. BL0902]